MSETTEPKPCPFCGSTSVAYRYNGSRIMRHDGPLYFFWIECELCGARTKAFTEPSAELPSGEEIWGKSHALQKAKAAWNRRSA